MRFRGWTGSYYIYGDGYKQDMFGVEYVQRIGEWHRVERVEAFIASDKNGAEVYEGDTVINEQILMGGKLYVKEHVAHYNGCATAEDGCYLVTRQIAAYTHLKK